MKIRVIFLPVFFMLSAAIACSCNKSAPASEYDDTLTLSTDEISVGPEECVVKINLTADCDWGVYSEDKTWVSVNPSSGLAGDAVLEVAIKANPSQDNRRSTNLVFKYGTSRKSVPVEQNIFIEDAGISDSAFKAYLMDQYDTDGDGIFSTKEALTVSKIEVSGLGIKNMPGLGVKFPSLTYLDCSDNELTELDLSGLPNLTYLDCSDNDLNTLDISLLVGLETFDATGNDALAAINVWTGFKGGESFRKPDTAEWKEPEITTPAGYQLVWQDEFNDPSFNMPNTAEWWYETAEPGWVNNELQTYVAGRTGDIVTADVSNGTLKIRAIKDGSRVYSARVNTKDGWTYGYFEARLKLPKGKGTWPAFWMMPTSGGSSWPKCGEIDIMEHVGADLNQVSSSIHCQSYYHAIGTQKTKARYLSGATDEFHVYALEWTPEFIRSFVDGEQLFYYKPEDHGPRNENTWPFDKPFQLKLNLAWGGDWGGYKGIDESCLPQTYEIDYVRVFQKP